MEEIKKQPFICPYCKQSEGFRSEKPVRGKDVLFFDEFGESIDGDMSYTAQYKEKFYCSNCNRGITKAVKKYLCIEDD
jgi:hypothetical protein